MDKNFHRPCGFGYICADSYAKVSPQEAPTIADGQVGLCSSPALQLQLPQALLLSKQMPKGSPSTDFLNLLLPSKNKKETFI